MNISLFYELDKYANTKSINLNIFGKYLSFARECKKKHPQHKEFLDLIKNSTDADYKSYNSVEDLIADLGIDYRPNEKKKWHPRLIFDYANLLFPSRYNWINFTFFELNIEKDYIVFTILGIGVELQKY